MSIPAYATEKEIPLDKFLLSFADVKDGYAQV